MLSTGNYLKVKAQVKNSALESATYQNNQPNNVSLYDATNINISIHDASSSERNKLEQFIKDLFKRRHGANIQHFMPMLMALSKQDGTILAVCGLRKAELEPLFLERYLSVCIEDTLSDLQGKKVLRSAITEIGNLAVDQPESIRRLLTCINIYLHKSNTDWAVFTGISTLKNSLNKLNIPLLNLGDALIEAIPPEERMDWGSYYQEKPEVMAIKRNSLVK